MLIAPPPPVPIVTVDRPTQVSAYGSGVLFSKRDPARAASSSGTRRPAGRPRRSTSPTAPCRSTPTSARARTAISSRSTRAVEPSRAGTRSTRTRRRTTRSAAAATSYELDLTTGAERRLPASSTTADETLPAVWKDGLAFARRYSSGKTVLYSRRGDAASRSDAGRPGGRAAERRSTSTAAGSRSVGTYPGTLRRPGLRPATGRRRRPAARGSSTASRGGGLTTISLTAPAFEGGKLYYARLCQGDEAGCPHRAGLIRVRYSTGERARADIGRYDLWQARGAGVTYVLHDDEGARSCYNTADGRLPRDVHDPGDDTRVRLIREAVLRERADPAKAPDMQRYMKSAMPFLGVQKPARVALARRCSRRTVFEAWDTVLALWREATYREERYMALALLEDRRSRVSRDRRRCRSTRS